MTTVADHLVKLLVAAGVKRIFGIAGDSLNALTDAVRRSDGAIEWVHVHNEESAAFAASAAAQLTGEIAVCAGSCGPGNTHLIQGVMDAHRSGAPVLALASHIASKQIGSGFFQETRPAELFRQASHYCEAVDHPSQLDRNVRLALQSAVGLGGASVLVLPGDVLASDAEGDATPSALVKGRPLVTPRVEEIDELAERLSRAEKVAIFAGIGCAGSRDDVLRLAAALQAPIGHSLRGKEIFGYDNPYDVGMTGLLGYGGCYKSLHEADLVLLLGTDFPYDDFLPKRNTVQVDIDPSRLGRRTPLVQAIAGDVGATARAVLDRIKPREERGFLDDMLKLTKRQIEHSVTAYASDRHQHAPIHPEYLAALVDEMAAPDAVFTVDTGMCCTWAARFITPNGQRRILGSFVHGSMADALPMAIGAGVADPGRQVVAFCGDGGLSMLLGELLTVRLHDLPTKIVVFNNGSLGMVRLEMLVAGDPPYATDHPRVDFAAVAERLGYFVRHVSDPADLRQAVADVLAHPGRALLDVETDPDALEIPSDITAAEIKGFAVSLGKMVLGGGLRETLHIAAANIRELA